MARKKTHEEFINNVFELVGNEYAVLGEYQGNKIKIEMIHNTCKHHFMTKPNVFLSGSRCPKCARKLRKDTDYFKQEVFDLVSNEYIVLGKYKNTNTKILFRHDCGNEFEMTPHSFLSGQRCPKCQHRSYKKTTEEFKQEIYALVSNEYELIGEYINNRTKVTLLHKECGNVYNVTPSDFIRGHRCCYCYGNIKKTQEEFEQLVYNMYKDEYTVIGDYINSGTKTEIKHNKCGNTWSVMPRDFLNNKSHCPECSYSKGETRICEYLKLYNVENIPQRKYDGLVGINNGLLSYDFYLPLHNILIEYQGEQHERFIKGIHITKKNFEKQLEHDRRKKLYAINNNIKLLEIWYWDFDNIESILNKELFDGNCGNSVAFIV